MLRLQLKVTDSKGLKEKIKDHFKALNSVKIGDMLYTIDTNMSLEDIYVFLEQNTYNLEYIARIKVLTLDTSYKVMCGQSKFATIFDNSRKELDKIIYAYNKEPEMVHFGKVLQNKQSNIIPVESETGYHFEVKHGDTLTILRTTGMTAPTALAMVLGRLGVTNIQRSKTREGYSLISIPDAKLLDLKNISQQFISAFPRDVLKVLFNRKDIDVDLSVDKYYSLSERFITEIVPVVEDVNMNKYRLYTENNLTRILRDRYNVVLMNDVFSKMLQVCPEIKSIEKTGTNRISIETALSAGELYDIFAKLKIADIVKTLYIKKETYYTKIEREEV